MRIAIMSTLPSMEGIVPDSFEGAPAMLVYETDTGSVYKSFEGQQPEEYARIAVKYGCEAVVCGRHIKKESFNIIADECITRYAGAGLAADVAAGKALYGSLPIIPEYEGGPGCSSGKGACEENGCGH